MTPVMEILALLLLLPHNKNFLVTPIDIDGYFIKNKVCQL